MEQLPQDWPTLVPLVLILGLKHGLDADHLAIIDGLARHNSLVNPALARYCGLWFSLGHGAVVIVAALAVNLLAQAWAPPQWLERFGALISIFFLGLVGVANLLAVLRAPPRRVARAVGLKGRWLGGLQRAARPVLIALVGGLFALSFDAMSLASLFALSVGQWPAAIGLGLLFMLGMLITDGLNGLWVSRLLRRADRAALLASRIMGLAVAGVSLATAGWGVAKFFAATPNAWRESIEPFAGVAVIAVLCLAFAPVLLTSHSSEAE